MHPETKSLLRGAIDSLNHLIEEQTITASQINITDLYTSMREQQTRTSKIRNTLEYVLQGKSIRPPTKLTYEIFPGEAKGSQDILLTVQFREKTPEGEEIFQSSHMHFIWFGVPGVPGEYIFDSLIITDTGTNLSLIQEYPSFFEEITRWSETPTGSTDFPGFLQMLQGLGFVQISNE